MSKHSQYSTQKEKMGQNMKYQLKFVESGSSWITFFAIKGPGGVVSIYLMGENDFSRKRIPLYGY